MKSLLESKQKDFSRKEKERILCAYAEKARRHFLDYAFYMDKSYMAPVHLRHLINRLEAVERGDLRRLMVFMPPRHGKSLTISKKFPAWYLGRHPDHNIILTSYSFSLARTFSKNVRDQIEDRKYKTIFDISTAEDSRQVRDWDIAGHTGGLLAQGVGGGITGFGANIFTIDDPFKNKEEAESVVIREKVWDWYTSVALTRLEPNSAIIIVMTRWHRDDLAGRILASEDDWEVINLPALAEGQDILSRKKGEALWPDRYSRPELLKIKSKVGSRVWFALYQGNPQDPEDQKFKREWFQYYDNLPVDIVRRGAGMDTATSLKDSADNTSLVDVCLGSDGYLYVDDCFCDKITVSGAGKHLINQHRLKKYSQVKLEKNNAGEAFKQRIDELVREDIIKTGMPFAVPVECEQTTTDKMVRAMEFQALVENGTLRFNRKNKKVMELVEHLINFDGKGGDVDDDVDALGFAIKAVVEPNAAAIATVGYDVY